ncbi:MAG TPA: carboxymuconolactone decarboxylase family protein [Stellaceae bacterium]|jgi:4-carboxymuconolactone decarboxylase|nr:carboxymuconolactone decarboxylase family protein [Stellaceae bacterium]
MKPPRFPQLAREALGPEQQRVAEEILKVSSGGLGGPYNVLLRSPVLADRILKLADYLRFNTSVPRRLNEMAILIQARLWTAQYEWWAHHPLALKAGLAPAIAEDLKAGKRPAAMQPDEAAVYDFCVELSKRRQVSDATFARARDLLGEQPLVDLVALTGFYAQVSMILNVAEAPIPGGGAPPLAPLADPLPLAG